MTADQMAKVGRSERDAAERLRRMWRELVRPAGLEPATTGLEGIESVVPGRLFGKSDLPHQAQHFSRRSGRCLADLGKNPITDPTGSARPPFPPQTMLSWLLIYD